jgi:hypothetical protein
MQKRLKRSAVMVTNLGVDGNKSVKVHRFPAFPTVMRPTRSWRFDLPSREVRKVTLVGLDAPFRVWIQLVQVAIDKPEDGQDGKGALGRVLDRQRFLPAGRGSHHYLEAGPLPPPDVMKSILIACKAANDDIG